VHQEAASCGFHVVVGPDSHERAERHRDRFASLEPHHLAGERFSAPLHVDDVPDPDSRHAEAKAQPRDGQDATCRT
jgi:hypothetical protein